MGCLDMLVCHPGRASNSVAMEAVEKLEEEYPPVPEIPFDLFLSKNHKAFGGDGRLQFTDSSRNLIFEVESRSTDSPSPSPPHRRKLLLDAAGTTLVTMVRVIVSLSTLPLPV